MVIAITGVALLASPRCAVHIPDAYVLRQRPGDPPTPPRILHCSLVAIVGAPQCLPLKDAIYAVVLAGMGELGAKPWSPPSDDGQVESAASGRRRTANGTRSGIDTGGFDVTDLYRRAGFDVRTVSSLPDISPASQGRPPLEKHKTQIESVVASLRCQARSVAGQTGKTSAQAPARHQPCQRGIPHPVGRVVPHPAGLPAQHSVLVAEHQQLSNLRPVITAQQDNHAEHPARQHVSDLQQHSASQAPRRPAVGNSAGQLPNRVFERHGARSAARVARA